jgi:cytochrome c5
MHPLWNFIGVLVMAGSIAACSEEQPTQPPTPQTTPPATAPSAPEPPAATPAPKPEGAGASSGGGGGQTAVAQGEQVYNNTCAACHAMGVAGAPKLGDKAAWAPRIAQGEQVMFQHAKMGFQGKTGFMPPKGGNPALTDEQLRAAVDYMVRKSK